MTSESLRGKHSIEALGAGSELESATAQRARGASLDQVRSHLRRADPVLRRLIDAKPTFDPEGWMAELPEMDLFGALLFQITGQQLSVAATRRTLSRIELLFGGHLPSPAELLEIPQESLRQAGLSWRKVATLRDLAERLSDGRLEPAILSKLPDDEVIAALTTIPRDRTMDRSGRTHPRASARGRGPSR